MTKTSKTKSIPTTIEQALREHGSFAHGAPIGADAKQYREAVDESAAEWRDAGFSASEVDSWLRARVFTPRAARALLAVGMSPDDANRESGPDQGIGAYTDTLGYKVANRDMTAADAEEHFRSW